VCTVSMIGDHYRDKWTYPVTPTPLQPLRQVSPTYVLNVSPVTREEFDALKRDVEEMKALLKRAKDYDARNGEPDCEMDEKMDLLRKVAKLVGVSLDDVISPAPRSS
jgi:hypothetical protein